MEYMGILSTDGQEACRRPGGEAAMIAVIRSRAARSKISVGVSRTSDEVAGSAWSS
jgi:hypothetical protein